MYELSNFDSIQIGLASPEKIREWSYGEVLKPETINYRTQKPERDGLFCERIFGPVRDWECHCGRYKRLRYKGVICEKCGVEVTKSKVRRERMGHIELACPVTHIWYLRGVPSKIGTILDIPLKELEQVVYLVNLMVLDPCSLDLRFVKDTDFAKEIVGKESFADIFDAKGENLIVAAGEEISEDAAQAISELKVKVIRIGGEVLYSISSEVKDLLVKTSKVITDADKFSDTIQFGDKLESLLDAVKAGKVTKEAAKEQAIEGIVKELVGQISVEDIALPKSDEVLVKANEVITTEAAQAIAESKISSVKVTSINKEIVGRLVYDDIVDAEGEVIIPAYTALTEDDIYKMVALGDTDCKLVAYNKELNNKLLYSDIEDKSTHKLIAIEQTQINKDVFEALLSSGFTKVRINRFDNMKRYQVISHAEYFDFQASVSKDDFKGFRIGSGAEAIKELLVELREKKFSDGEDKLVKYVDYYRHQVAINNNKSNTKERKRLEILEAFKKSGNKPEWMVLDVIPVLPPDLRPMVQLDGGRFATSDLNDLYRRLINRNSRLKKMKEQGAPEIMLANEKRMLQEIVDALIDNGRRGKPFVGGSSKRELKSLSAYLRGKQGRFRQNLLGKRVDYSGRSVIVVGPELKLYQCGLPKEMALELFKPFIMNKLVERDICHNIKIAKRYVDTGKAQVWDILEEIIKDHPVLLNRAPTLHRLGIQAFEPVLVEGRAIKLHPLACTAFNADFDGDQMAVHVPLSIEAQAEARILMLCTNNILKLSDGKPVVSPTQDMVMGAYYLTIVKPGAKGEGNFYSSMDEAIMAYNDHDLTLQSLCYIRVKYVDDNGVEQTKLLHTTLGRAIFNENIPQDLQLIDRSIAGNEALLEVEGILGYEALFDQKQYKYLVDEALSKAPDYDKIRGIIRNRRLSDAQISKAITLIKEYNAENPIVVALDGKDVPGVKLLKERVEKEFGNKVKAIGKKQISIIIDNCFKLHGATETAEMLDKVKALGFKYSTIGSITTSVFDMNIPDEKKEAVEKAEKKVEKIEKLYARGILSDEGRYKEIISIWKDTIQEVEDALQYQGDVDDFNPIWMMANSGARGSMGQIRQLSGMRGLMSDPSGRTIELPVRSSFREGLSVLEYFISSHGGRKGLVDTALKTADSGYLTRRLVDVSHSVIVCDKDCGDKKGTFLTAIRDSRGIIENLSDRISGRYSVGEVIDPKTKEVICEADTLIDADTAKKIDKALTSYWEENGKDMHNQPGIWIRSILTCKTKNGVCVKCYGKNMASGNPVKIGEAVGIIAAQSIGEPGTQLTMRTFHSGGVASEDDITQGLPRVEELFEARNPKGAAIITENNGTVAISKDRREITVTEYDPDTKEVIESASYQIPYNANILVNDGDVIEAGEQLTKGSINPQTMLKIKGVRGVQEYIAKEVQSAYRTSGVEINDKHVEVIVRQMLRKVLIEDQGDTNMIPGTYVDIFSFETENERVMENDGVPATAKRTLLGITKSALATESFLSAASFQETPRALADAAINNKVDPLLGLKENVIIGKLIPAGTGMKCYQNIATVSTEAPKVVEEELPEIGDMFDIEDDDKFIEE